MRCLVFVVVFSCAMSLVAQDRASSLLMRQASGTSMNPNAAPMAMSMTSIDRWMLMFHGAAFLNQVVQTGPRGGDALFSTNWAMGVAQRPVGSGQLMLRSMLSLEPATIRGGFYPELFQTGETAHGRPISSGQHPHDFFMELAAEYALPIGDGVGYLYAAPVGDPSLGPVAYPHRVSAMELPQATLGHHNEDSTHIANSVITVGAQRGPFGLGFSGFHGAEPDEGRWDIDTGKIDSWAARFTFDPTANWTAQISTGHLRKPEAFEPGNVQRTTASVSYATSSLAASLIAGHNRKEHRSTTAWTAEGMWRFRERDYATVRAEVVDKDELFNDADVPVSIAEGSYRIKAFTAGYTRDVLLTATATVGVGGNATLYRIPPVIQPYFGSRPFAAYIFVRARSRAASNLQHEHMHMGRTESQTTTGGSSTR